MDSLSDYALVGVVEVIGILLVILVVLFLLNRKLQKRIDQLTEWLKKLKDTTRTLISEANTAGHRYIDHLAEELKDTEQIFAKFSPGKKIDFHEDQNSSTHAIALRHKFLKIELDAHATGDEDEKWMHLTHTLNQIVSESGIQQKFVNDKEKRSDQAKQLKEVCDAAVHVVYDRSNEAEDNLMSLLKRINKEVGLEIEEWPERDGDQDDSPSHNLTNDIHNLKNISGQQKDLISNLLSQRNAAEAEITIKADELLKLQRFLAESELCITLLEQELQAVQNSLNELTKSVAENHEMKESMSNFAIETVELLGCIEALEKENEDLRSRFGSPEI